MNTVSIHRCPLRAVIVAVLIVSVGSFAFSQPEISQTGSVGFDFAYYPPDQKGYGVSDGGFAPISFDVLGAPGLAADYDSVPRDLGSTWGNVELKGYYNHQWTVPAMRWSGGPLFAGNNVSIRSTTGISPVSATQEFQIVATPIAVAQLTAGAFLGTGWNAVAFDGLGNLDQATGEVDDSSFEGAVLRGKLGATLQFDWAAVFPGDWNHVVMVFSPMWTYGSFTGAGAEQPWSFEADSGTNYNGWTMATTSFLGYQLPVGSLNTVGLLLETDRIVGAAVDNAAVADGDWDPGFRELKAALVFNFLFGEAHTLTLLPQVSLNRLAGSETDTVEDRRNSVFESTPQARDTIGSYWDAYRLAVSYRYQLNF